MDKRYRKVTERDLRMPEFRDVNPEDLDKYEFHADGKIVRKDRWEDAIHSIRSALGDFRDEFEIPEIVSAVQALVASIPRPEMEVEDTGSDFYTGEAVRQTSPSGTGVKDDADPK